MDPSITSQVQLVLPVQLDLVLPAGLVGLCLALAPTNTPYVNQQRVVIPVAPVPLAIHMRADLVVRYYPAVVVVVDLFKEYVVGSFHYFLHCFGMFKELCANYLF